MAKRKQPPKLFVVFDTNVLFTQVASDLLRKDVQRIIAENSSHQDLNISWYLPDVVIGERKYQMLEKAKELLPGMQKLERLIGHTFGIAEDSLELHVDKAIMDSIEKYQLQKIEIDTSKVDWISIIDRSIKRKPPFEAKEKEKGFRDSIIAQSFFQLLQKSPSTPSVCRLAFVSEDEMLREHVTQFTEKNNNVRILSSLDELESLINTLVSTIPEEFAGELAKKAGKIFFEKGNEKTLYYKENIREKIKEQFSNELSNTTILGHSKSHGTWYISSPKFKKKEKQRIYWISRVEVEFEIYHYAEDDTNGATQLAFSNYLNEQSSTQPLGPLSLAATVRRRLDSLSNISNKIIDQKGRDKFEVHWNANLTAAHNLTSPILENIEFIGNDDKEGNS